MNFIRLNNRKHPRLRRVVARILFENRAGLEISRTAPYSGNELRTSGSPNASHARLTRAFQD